MSERKSQFLGMGFSKATQRLRKMIMLKLVIECGQDNCFKCGLKIETVEELSVEHKLPWQNRDKDLFWDLNNIAFSHRKCNRPHSYNTPIKRREFPEGTSWCAGHKTFLSEDLFNRKANTRNGLQVNCNECHDVK